MIRKLPTDYPGPFDPRLVMLQWEMDRYVEKHYEQAAPPPRLIDVNDQPARTDTGSRWNRILVALAPLIAIGLIIGSHFLSQFLIDL